MTATWPSFLFAGFGLCIILGFRGAFGYVHPLILLAGLCFIFIGWSVYRAARSTAALVMDLRRGKGVLATWTCPDPAWSDLARSVLRKEVQERWREAARIAAACVLLGAPGWYLGLAPWWAVPLTLLCVVVFTLALLQPAWARTRRRQVQVVIGRRGMLVGPEIHIWGRLSGTLGSCAWVRQGPELALGVTWQRFAGKDHQPVERSVVVPVPSGREADAQRVVQALNAPPPPRHRAATQPRPLGPFAKALRLVVTLLAIPACALATGGLLWLAFEALGRLIRGDWLGAAALLTLAALLLAVPVMVGGVVYSWWHPGPKRARPGRSSW
jgi:hypothetical protein